MSEAKLFGVKYLLDQGYPANTHISLGCSDEVNLLNYYLSQFTDKTYYLIDFKIVETLLESGVDVNNLPIVASGKDESFQDAVPLALQSL